MEARLQLEKLQQESMSLSQSIMDTSMSQSIKLSQANFGNVPSIPRINENILYNPVLDSERSQLKKISHEMGVGSDSVQQVSHSVSTDVKNLVTKDEIGVNTKVATTNDANIATHTTFAQAGSQAGALTKDTGCDGKPAAQTVNSGNQMDVLEQAS